MSQEMFGFPVSGIQIDVFAFSVLSASDSMYSSVTDICPAGSFADLLVVLVLTTMRNLHSSWLHVDSAVIINTWVYFYDPFMRMDPVHQSC